MAATEIRRPVGVVIGDPIDAATLNGKLRDPYQQLIDNYKAFPGIHPFLWDVTDSPTITTINSSNSFPGVNTFTYGSCPPGIVYIDMSTFSNDKQVFIQPTVTLGAYLFIPINIDEAPEAQIIIDATAYTKVNNTLVADLPTPNQFRIHNRGTTFVASTTDRLFCKDGFFFRAVLTELENNAASLQAIPTNIDFTQLQNDLDNNIISQINTSLESTVDSNIAVVTQVRREVMRWSLKSMSGTSSKNNLYQHAEVVTLTDLVSTNPTITLPVTNDMMKFVVVIPPTAAAETLQIDLTSGPGIPVGTFTNMMVNITVNSVKSMPFFVDIDNTLHNTTHFFESEGGEDITIYRQPALTSLVNI